MMKQNTINHCRLVLLLMALMATSAVQAERDWDRGSNGVRSHRHAADNDSRFNGFSRQQPGLRMENRDAGRENHRSKHHADNRDNRDNRRNQRYNSQPEHRDNIRNKKREYNRYNKRNDSSKPARDNNKRGVGERTHQAPAKHESSSSRHSTWQDRREGKDLNLSHSQNSRPHGKNRDSDRRYRDHEERRLDSHRANPRQHEHESRYARNHDDERNRYRYKYEPRRHINYRHSYRGRPKYRLHHRHRYSYYRTPWYSTRYLAPIRIRYHSVGYRVHYLPQHCVRVVVASLPYFYFSGVFYRPFDDDYVVVAAPYGAVVAELPVGYIAFNNGFDTYFYVNATYYRWSDSEDAFVVVEKPDGADDAIKEATQERLYAYPNAGQSEEQQAKDRYECHQWAVSEANVDPTLEDENEQLAMQDVLNYRRALSACLIGKDYSVE